ncbi:MAG: cytidyltransferase, partial [Proteocatella sp.]
LIDPLAQKYIYRYGLYKREPMFKSYFSNITLKTEIIDDCSLAEIETLIDSCIEQKNVPEISKWDIIDKLSKYDHLRAVVVKDEKTGKILGFTTNIWLRSTEYYSEFKDKKISDYIRQKSIGRIAYINGMCINEYANINNLYQIILTETITTVLEKDYTYCIYKNIIPVKNPRYEKIFELQGFEYLTGDNHENSIQCVSMTKPIVLNLDLRSMLKEPFRSNKNIKKEIYKTRENLQRALTNLYKGELVLSFDRSVTYGKLIKKVCDINNVEYEVKHPRVLGENMCVPFGATLNGALVPNTVTKSLHTEKIFNSDLSKFKIGEFPNYMSMQNQIKLLASFKRPIILIDDILHKGHRIKALDPMFRNEKIEVRQIVVAILSGQGKEIMDRQEREVEYIYFLPNLKNWFNENALYPFMGGDYVYREGSPEAYILSSMNFILPYASPTFVHDTDPKNIYELSEVCINNAISIFETIEKEYQYINERSFNLKKIGEVFQKPRKPDYGKCVEFDLDLKPSEYLKNDLEKLKRLKNIIYR